LNALGFWKEHPADVAGLILLDPPPRAWLERERFDGLWELAVAAGAELQAAATQAMDEASPQADQLETMASEHVGMLEAGAIVAGIDSFEDVPLFVIAAGRANPAFGDSAAAYQSFWVAESRKLAGRSSRGRVEVLESVGHNMNQEVPELLVSLIRGFLAGF
jgi:pimeloyl-ACP methyl ester carboxylesterase